MKKLQKFALLLLAVSTVSLTACKDDDDDDNDVPVVQLTASQKLIAKNYRVTADVLVANGQTEDFFVDYDDCEKDDITDFREGGVLVEDEGPTKCDPNDDQTEVLMWSLSDNDKKLTVFDNLFSLTVDIITNNGTTLIIEIKETDDFDGDGDDEEGIFRTTFTAI